MFILKCIHQDADLFFETLNARNDNLYKYFKHKKFKYHSTIICTITPKNTPDDGLYSYIRIDITDTLELFIKLRKFKPFLVLSLHHNISFRHYSLDSNLKGHIYLSREFVVNMRINWKVQHIRAYQKQLLDITG